MASTKWLHHRIWCGRLPHFHLLQEEELVAEVSAAGSACPRVEVSRVEVSRGSFFSLVVSNAVVRRFGVARDQFAVLWLQRVCFDPNAGTCVSGDSLAPA